MRSAAGRESRDRVPGFADSSFVQTLGYLSHIRTRGDFHDRPPLLLLHGFLDSTSAWDGVADGLAANRRVLLLDLLGHGYTERPAKSGYAVEELLDQIAAVQTAVKAPCIHLAGNSLGGILAVRYALAHPSRVVSVTVVDGGVGGLKVPVPHALVRLLTLFPLWDLFWLGLRLFESHWAEWVFREFLQGENAPETTAVQAFLRPLRQPGASRATGRLLRGYSASFRGGKDRGVKEEFASLGKPVLLVWGEKDRLVPVRVAEVLHRDIPGSRLAVLPGCGHCPQREAPEEFIRVLRDFLESADP